MKHIKNFFIKRMIIKSKRRPSIEVLAEATWVCGGGEC